MKAEEIIRTARANAKYGNAYVTSFAEGSVVTWYNRRSRNWINERLDTIGTLIPPSQLPPLE